MDQTYINMGKVPIIGGSSLLALVLLTIRTPKEEWKLVERFGDEYREYMAVTGRFFPQFRE